MISTRLPLNAILTPKLLPYSSRDGNIADLWALDDRESGIQRVYEFSSRTILRKSYNSKVNCALYYSLNPEGQSQHPCHTPIWHQEAVMGTNLQHFSASLWHFDNSETGNKRVLKACCWTYITFIDMIGNHSTTGSCLRCPNDRIIPNLRHGQRRTEALSIVDKSAYNQVKCIRSEP